MGVSPFRDLRVLAYVQLTAAFRSLSRLSSAPSAKASALCSFCLTASQLHSVVTERPSLVLTSICYLLRCLPILLNLLDLSVIFLGI